ncbi:MAG: hypothetical protein E7474_12775 [Ruminococcaceae bacterium]|nr:hypothetical protein [Oscillospiraceae bacterium]
MDKQTIQTRKRRFLSLCMALVMALGLLPLNAMAETWSEDGSSIIRRSAVYGSTVYNVTFHTNGGSAIDPNPQYVTEGGQASKPVDPTKDGLSFGGWYKDEACTIPYDFGAGVNGDLDLYAKWGHNIEVTIDAFQGDVTLQLMRGGKELAKKVVTISDSDNGRGSGSVTFPGNPDGIYNLVATQNHQFDPTNYPSVTSELIKTSAVIVKGEAVTTAITMPATDASSVADLQVADTVVGGLDELAAALNGWSWLTTQLNDLGLVLSSSHVEVNMELKPFSGATAAETAAMDEMRSRARSSDLGKDPHLTELLINVNLKVTPYGSTDTTTIQLTKPQLTEKLPKRLEIILPIKNGDTQFHVYREHGGDITELNPLGSRRLVNTETGLITATREGWVFDPAAKLLYIYADNFSGYLIAGARERIAPAPAPTNPPPHEQDDGPKSYYVEVLRTAFGTVESDHIRAEEGTKVTLTAKPEDGYDLAALTVTAAVRGYKLPLTENGGVYTFTMPACDVRVKGTFQTTAASAGTGDPNGSNGCPRDNTCPMTGFADLDKWAWYHDGVHFVLEHGIMQGMGNNLFAPNGIITRAQMAQILWNLEGRPASSVALAYTDVVPDGWYVPAIRWVTEQNVMKGYNKLQFGPDDPLTREQLVTILYRYAQSKGFGFAGAWAFPLDFPDAADVAEWAYEPMCWVTMKGIVNGKDGRLAPKDSATRAEVSAIMQRYCQLLAQ